MRKRGEWTMGELSLFSRFAGIKNRCNNPKVVGYRYYGGRGIKCKWKTLKSFSKDIYRSYLKHVREFGDKNTTIERIDVNGHYCKENCRWATWIEQANNKRPRTLAKALKEVHYENK